MFSNPYPLSNTTFINLGRAQFLCDLITGVSIDICDHIFQTIRKTAAQSAARGCIPFCSLIMKFILCEGINPPLDGKMMTCPHPISMITLQASKSHSSRTPKSEPSTIFHICSPRVSNNQAKPLDCECGSSDIRVRTASSLLSQSNSNASHNY